ncbi:phage filamentation protein Fil family protein [Candidatus Fukatsuia symbiotica]|uniref:phage filamentation protein Fil family protein n=1 Tax=Candidatus Fukatsuia symbiotica TaxID=1878942 RepID=UPI0013C3597F|nr:phage filamentation protein Fil family protein [Candidatus Fukatsuia symbiotica]
MLIKTCTSVAVLPDNPLHITHRRHRRGWLETPDGRHVQPNAQDVQFIKGMSTPVINKPRRRWFCTFDGDFCLIRRGHGEYRASTCRPAEFRTASM